MQFPCLLEGGAGDPKDSSYNSAAAERQSTAILRSIMRARSAVINFSISPGLTFKNEGLHPEF